MSEELVMEGVSGTRQNQEVLMIQAPGGHVNSFKI